MEILVHNGKLRIELSAFLVLEFGIWEKSFGLGDLDYELWDSGYRL